ncbi:MAG: hypothetical protein DWQ01_14710 [Planctomycetota bacterium]|nr:MAG: hypothetical protein DWQ01_14710 [Planctomycetota bacterium]
MSKWVGSVLILCGLLLTWLWLNPVARDQKNSRSQSNSTPTETAKVGDLSTSLPDSNRRVLVEKRTPNERIIRGVVVDEAGLPQAGIPVLCEESDFGDRATITDALGLFEFPWLAREDQRWQYRVTLTAAPKAPQFGGRVVQSVWEPWPEPLQVQIHQGSLRQVKVQWEDDQSPVAQARVQLTWNPKQSSFGNTNENGLAKLAFPKDLFLPVDLSWKVKPPSWDQVSSGSVQWASLQDELKFEIERVRGRMWLKAVSSGITETGEEVLEPISQATFYWVQGQADGSAALEEILSQGGVVDDFFPADGEVPIIVVEAPGFQSEFFEIEEGLDWEYDENDQEILIPIYLELEPLMRGVSVIFLKQGQPVAGEAEYHQVAIESYEVPGLPRSFAAPKFRAKSDSKYVVLLPQDRLVDFVFRTDEEEYSGGVLDLSETSSEDQPVKVELEPAKATVQVETGLDLSLYPYPLEADVNFLNQDTERFPLTLFQSKWHEGGRRWTRELTFLLDQSGQVEFEVFAPSKIRMALQGRRGTAEVPSQELAIQPNERKVIRLAEDAWPIVAIYQDDPAHLREMVRTSSPRFKVRNQEDPWLSGGFLRMRRPGLLASEPIWMIRGHSAEVSWVLARLRGLESIALHSEKELIRWWEGSVQVPVDSRSPLAILPDPFEYRTIQIRAMDGAIPVERASLYLPLTAGKPLSNQTRIPRKLSWMLLKSRGYAPKLVQIQPGRHELYLTVSLTRPRKIHFQWKESPETIYWHVDPEANPAFWFYLGNRDSRAMPPEAFWLFVRFRGESSFQKIHVPAGEPGSEQVIRLQPPQSSEE